MRPPETIETARLILRKPDQPQDASAVYRSYSGDARVTRYLTWKPHRDLGESERSLRARLKSWIDGSEFCWVFSLKQRGPLLGMVSATPGPDGSGWSLGYVLAHSWRGRGYGTEAARAVLEALVALPGVGRIWAVADEDNFASMRVLEKIGLRREQLLRGWSVHPALGERPRNCWCFGWGRPPLAIIDERAA